MRVGLVALLACCTAWGASSAGVVPTSRAGFVDLEITGRSSPGLEALVAEQRFVEAFHLAVAELRDRTRRLGPEHPETLLALHRVGTVAHLAGDQATAEDVLAATLAARRKVLHADDPAIIETLLRSGRAARFRGDRRRARACYDESATLLAGRSGREAAVLEGERRQLDADWIRGQNETDAIGVYERALALRRATFSSPSFAVADNETWLAWTLARVGRRAEATRYARDAARQLDELGLAGHSLHATLDELLADDLTLAGRPDEAEKLYRASAKSCASVRRRQWGGFPRKGFPLDGFETLAVAALRRGDGEEAWTLLETARAASHVDFSVIGLWRSRDPDGFAAWTTDRRALDASRKRLAEQSGGAPVWSAVTERAFLEMLELRARISGTAERYLEAHRPEVPSIQQVRNALGPRDALIGWLELRVGGTPTNSVGPDRSEAYAFVIRSSGPVRWVPLWENRSAAENRAMTAAWGHVFGVLVRAASWPTRLTPDAQIYDWMRAWARKNVDPILPYLEGVDHLVLERLTEPVDLAVLPNGKILGDAFDVSYVPSALTLVLLSEGEPRRAPSPSDSILAVAGPTEIAREIRVDQLIGAADAPSGHRGGRSAYRRDDTPLERLPRLRYAELEVRAVASSFKRAIVLGGDDASSRIARLAAQDRLADFRVVHVATHTLTDGAPERCALALSTHGGLDPGENSGILEVEDIALNWRLDADLMTLSGCETLRAAGTGRGEPYGFTAALFGAGARRILSSQWPVDDRATTILMNRFYENYTGSYKDVRLGTSGAPMKAPRALREARAYVRTLADGSGRRPYEHPVYWAGFFLLGLPD
jgi:tetratricopeptide (TPR) repeat protein